MQITFLGQSGFAVDTGRFLLLFDYAPRRQKALTDPILARLIRDRRLLVFVSHAHADHFDEAVWTLPAEGWFVGEGVPPRKEAAALVGGEVLNFPDFTVKTWRSTDEGVAFLVQADGRSIYHAGDLNWWHWSGEPDPWNPDMAKAFLTQAEQIAREPIDLAFLTADPRQHEAWLWGFDYLMRHGRIARAVPMHFWNQAAAPEKVALADCTAPYRERILTGLCRCGDSLTL